MQFYISNRDLDNQITEIRKKIRLSMNGVTADSMKEKGVIYKQNFGVSLPILRDIAREYKPSNDLAQRLWIVGGRETMILSILLQPVDNLTFEKAIDRIKTVNQKEIIDILCMYLLSKTVFAKQLSLFLVRSETIQEQTAGFVLAARVFTDFNTNEISLLINYCRKKSDTSEYMLYYSVALCLARFCRLNTETANTIKKIVENFPPTPSPSQSHIANEVKLELDFFE